MVVYVTFLPDAARQKLLNSANVSRSYSQNNTGTVFLRHGVRVHSFAFIQVADCVRVSSFVFCGRLWKSNAPSKTAGI